jgi:hypothetical protein
MPRPKLVDRPKSIEIHIPQSLHEKLMRELYSDIEGRVPFGAVSQLYSELTTRWLESRGIPV